MKPTLVESVVVDALAAAVNAMTYKAMEARYTELCKQRDAVYDKTAPLQVELDKANAEAEAARVKAQDLADQIEHLWGGDWLKTKKELGLLAARMTLAKQLGLVSTELV